MALPIANPWYGHHRIDDRIFCLTEPHVHPIFSANIFVVQGRDADLVIDSGMGIAPLKPAINAIRRDPGKPLILFTTHAHIDHIGAACEFETRLTHPIEADLMASPPTQGLLADQYAPSLRAAFEAAGYPAFWPVLIDAVPDATYDPAAYALRAASTTQQITAGDSVDLGDWRAEVIHLPGHAAGQIGLWHAETGTLFSADALYDGPLICFDGAPGMDRAAYVDTLRKLREMPIARVLGGHDGQFGAARCQEIIDTHLAQWA